MAGLAILKHTFNLSDEALCERGVENPYYQLFCGEAFFRHDVSFDRSSMTRWRQTADIECRRFWIVRSELAGQPVPSTLCDATHVCH